jgi:nucleoside-diphosphate kinase
MNTENNQQNNGDHKEERTLTVIKPDGVQRSLIGEIVKRYERVGLKLVAIKMLVPTLEMIKKQYSIDPDWIRQVGQKNIDGYIRAGKTPAEPDPIKAGEGVVGRLAAYLTAGPVVAMVWQGAHAVQVVRKITGSTEPLTSAMGTIRGDYVLDSYTMSDIEGRAVRNLVHASGSPEEAAAEIKIWFNDNEIMAYTKVNEAITHSTNLNSVINPR